MAFLYVKPLESKFEMVLEVINDSFFMLFLYLMLIFAEAFTMTDGSRFTQIYYKIEM